MTAPIVDLRSDTVTRPTAAMRRAMHDAELGDDVFGDDPTVNALQERVAELLGKEAALFMPSGTMSNLSAIMSHCARGDEYLVGQGAHTYRYEAGGAAVLGSVQPQPIAHQADGSLALADIEAAIKPDDEHFARTRLLALENTIGGKVLPQAYVDKATALAHARGLATHLDGARLFNAAVKQRRDRARRTGARLRFSVSVCFSKGLGRAGRLGVGGLARASSRRAHRMRKMLGGGMRQAGVLAAAARHALEHHVDRLAEDHALAARLAAGLLGLAGLEVGRRRRTSSSSRWRRARPGVAGPPEAARRARHRADRPAFRHPPGRGPRRHRPRGDASVHSFFEGASDMPITDTEALTRCIDHREIFHDEMLALVRRIMSGEMSPVMMAAMLIGLRVKKETIGEITAAAQVMREFATKVEVADSTHLVDIVGTGGDGSHTFNISTCIDVRRRRGRRARQQARRGAA